MTRAHAYAFIVRFRDGRSGIYLSETRMRAGIAQRRSPAVKVELVASPPIDVTATYLLPPEVTE